jgi:hypothetical protein
MRKRGAVVLYVNLRYIGPIFHLKGCAVTELKANKVKTVKTYKEALALAEKD